MFFFFKIKKNFFRLNFLRKQLEKVLYSNLVLEGLQY